MPKYIIRYFFDGTGEVSVEAENEKEARAQFFQGDFENENEWGDSYNIDRVALVK